MLLLHRHMAIWLLLRKRNQRGSGNASVGILRVLHFSALLAGLLTVFVAGTAGLTASAEDMLPLAIDLRNPAESNIWQNGVGNGFNSGVQSLSLGVSVGYGAKIFGSRQSHDLALGDFSYGLMLGQVKGDGHWYKGNWELRAELFSGAQFSPSDNWVVGIAPHLRYNFATGTRWVPYFDLGAGVSATSIGHPDLSHTFEFNLQAESGVRWFFRDNLALGLGVRYLHMSCAGINSPNLGLNNFNGIFTLSYFFGGSR